MTGHSVGDGAMLGQQLQHMSCLTVILAEQAVSIHTAG